MSSISGLPEFKKLTVFPFNNFDAGVVKNHINYINQDGLNWTAYLQTNGIWLHIPEHQNYGQIHYDMHISLKTKNGSFHATYVPYLNKFLLVGEHSNGEHYQHVSTLTYFDWESTEHVVQL